MTDTVHQDIQPYHISAKSVAKYTLLPGVMPRLKRLSYAASKFLFFFTHFFGVIGLIEPTHPCLRPENIGRYKFSHIVAYAYSNLEISRRNIPQICMFIATIVSILLVFGIIFGFIAHFLLTFGTAHAQYFGYPADNNAYGWNRNGDWAFRFLERIFGSDTGINFWREEEVGNGSNPWFTLLLVGMLKHYSMALLVIAAFIIIYLLIITVAESAKTGQPFGTRFDSIWAPIRLAMAIGLLVPVAGPGYNTAQLIAFQVAEWGSNMATNLWFSAVDETRESKFFAATVADPGYRFLQDIFLVNACIEGYNRIAKQSGGMFKNMRIWESVSGDVRNFAYGPLVAPDWCGHVTIPDKEFMNKPNKVKQRKPADAPNPFWPFLIVQAHNAIADQFIPHGSGDTLTLGTRMESTVVKFVDAELDDKDRVLTEVSGPEPIIGWIQFYWEAMGRTWGEDTPYFSTGLYPSAVDKYNTWLVDSLKKDAKYGWASAGVFYLRMSNAMSLISKALENSPRVVKLPTNITRPYATPLEPKLNEEDFEDRCNGWFSWWPSGSCNSLSKTAQFSAFLKKCLDWFQTSPINDEVSYGILGGTYYTNALLLPEMDSPENTSTDTVMGPTTQALYDRVKINSQSLHPLGSVISWGTSLMAASGVAYVIAIIAGIFSYGAAAVFKSVGDVLLIPGFILAFLVPMLPFLYFMFAVIEWMISILEAVIGMPLWALSFVSLEGDFLGRGMEGVKMLFEIMLRPSIIIISLIVAVLIFSASIAFFNDSMELFINGYSGAASGQMGFGGNLVASIAMIFLYMFGVYSLATASFKLIDVIPDQFGRWMGLPQGFGSQIRTGIDAITGAVVGGALAKSAMGMADKGIASGQQARDQKKSNERSQNEQDAASVRSNTDSRQRQTQHAENMNSLRDIERNI